VLCESVCWCVSDGVLCCVRVCVGVLATVGLFFWGFFLWVSDCLLCCVRVCRCVSDCVLCCVRVCVGVLATVCCVV
jgi:hypothetical protein